MNRTIPSLLLAATASFAAVPVSFTSGSPAKADDVNKNFVALDSAIQKKADGTVVSVLQSALAAKADQAKLDDLARTVSSKAAQSELADKKDSAWIVATINGKLPIGTLSAKNNLSELKDSAAQVRANLGLKSLASLDEIPWSKVSKSGALATEVGSLDSNVVKSRFLPSNSEASLGGDLVIGNHPLRRTPNGDWLFGANSTEILIGSSAAGSEKTIKFFSGDTASLAVMSASGIQMLRPLSVGKKDQAGSIIFRRSRDGSQSGFIGFDADDKTINYFALSGGGAHAWWTNPGIEGVPTSKKMVLDGSGNLQVRGTITGSVVLASSIKSSEVADYVFEPDYKLAPLSEVEAYTKEHKHLPEVPSAAEIEQGGLDLAKMNLLLLKKVEELTLHTIALEKRLKAVETSTKP